MAVNPKNTRLQLPHTFLKLLHNLMHCLVTYSVVGNSHVDEFLWQSSTQIKYPRHCIAYNGEGALRPPYMLPFDLCLARAFSRWKVSWNMMTGTDIPCYSRFSLSCGLALLEYVVWGASDLYWGNISFKFVLFLYQLHTLNISFYLQSLVICLYVFRTDRSIIRRIKCLITQAASGTVPSVVDLSWVAVGVRL